MPLKVDVYIKMSNRFTSVEVYCFLLHIGSTSIVKNDSPRTLSSISMPSDRVGKLDREYSEKRKKFATHRHYVLM